MKKIYRVTFILLIISITVKLSAQEVHYWSHTYGTESTLLGGAVIGSVNDLGATYYNPGKLALTNDPNFLFSARIFEYVNLKIQPKDPIIDGASESYLRPSPAFIVYSLSSDWLGKNKLAFSLLTRHTFDVRLKTRYVGNVESTDISNELLYEGESGQYWGGITWAYPFKGKYKIGIGITNYFTVTSYRTRNSISIQSTDTSNTVGILSGVTEYDYYNIGVLWKAGIGFTFEKIKFGITVTSPSLNLLGSGSTDVNINSSGIDIDGDQQPDEFLISNYQKDLTSKYSSAYAVGFGIYYKFGDFKVHLAGEYYGDVSKYSVLASEEFQSQTGGYTLTNDLTNALKPVFNFGIGLEYLVNEKFTTYGAFVTDRSALNTDEESNHSFSKWDYYHITAGAALSFEEFELTFGLSLAFAGDDVEVPILPLSESEDIDFVFQRESAEVSSLRLKFILGIVF